VYVTASSQLGIATAVAQSAKRKTKSGTFSRANVPRFSRVNTVHARVGKGTHAARLATNAPRHKLLQLSPLVKIAPSTATEMAIGVRSTMKRSISVEIGRPVKRLNTTPMGRPPITSPSNKGPVNRRRKKTLNSCPNRCEYIIIVNWDLSPPILYFTSRETIVD